MSEEVVPGVSYVHEGRGLVADLKAFDQLAWAQVFDQHFESLVVYALCRVGQWSDAEELAAQVLEEALRGIGRYQERGVPLRAWLFRIARNVVSYHTKRRQRESRVPFTPIASDDGLESEVATQLRFWDALRHLSDEQRQVIVLRIVNDLSLKECAQATGKSLGDVKSLQARSFARLREYYFDAENG
jgi:RNA polymerase sigma-70 factor, ECF subfamily